MNSKSAAADWLARQRVARLATADAAGAPHVIPVCFVFDPAQASLYITIDEKPKDRSRPLKRLRNITENPQVALVADHYAEDWSQLGWVMVRGAAEILQAGEEYSDEHSSAQALLRSKYLQYRAMALEQLPVIALRIDRWTWWGRLSG